MYKLLCFQDFFTETRQNQLDICERDIALSLVSPNQMIHAVPNNNFFKTHLDLSLAIISDIYKISKYISEDIQYYRYRQIAEIAKYLKDGERNFIIIRYILLRDFRLAVIEYSAYITFYEYECMSKLDELYKEYKIETKAIIHRYNPIDNEVLIGKSENFEGNADCSALLSSLEYFKNNNSIIDYQLNAPKEYILKEK